MHSNIPKILADRNLSVSSLSKMTGLSRTTITALNKSVILPESTKIETLIKISTALNTSINNLVDFNELNVQYISSIEFFSELSASNVHFSEAFSTIEKDMPKEIYIYEGIKIVKINEFTKNLYIAYSGNTRGTLSLEILNSSDFTLLNLLSDNYHKYPKALFNFENSLNSNSEFLKSLSAQDTRKLAQKITDLREFTDILNKVSINNFKNIKPNVELSFKSTAAIYFKGKSDYSLESDFVFNSNNIITVNMVRTLLQAYNDDPKFNAIRKIADSLGKK